MNNFEKRCFLDYMDKLLNSIDFRSYSFDEVFDFFLYQFKVNKNHFKYDEDGMLLTETLKQRHELGKKLKTIVKTLKSKIPVVHTRLEQRFLMIKQIYNLKENEYQTFIYFMLQKLNRMFDRFDSSLYGSGFEAFANQYLGVRYCVKEQILNNLYQSKLITSKSSNISVNPDMVKIFNNDKCNTMDKIISELLGKPEKSTLTLKDYSHIEQQANKVINILKSGIDTKAKGINILLYGIIGCGKTEFSKLIANTISVPIYAVKTELSNGEEAKRNDRLIDLYSKQQILSRSGNACVLLDEAEDILNRGFGSDGSSSKGYMNKVLETTPVPVIWTTNNISDVDPAFLRRMTYCIEFGKLSDETRLNIWNKVLKKNKLKVSKTKVEELNKNYNIPPSLISNAVQTTKMINGSEDDFEDLIVNVAKVVQKKSNVKEEEKKEDIKSYDISLVNTDIDMNDLAEKIKQSGKLNFSLCLYGSPGTGKSAFSKYLAKELGIEVIYKRASDLMSKWVGETEQNIASAFKEARDKKAMLIFDEADSFLQDRANAGHSWEVSQVNEMLTWMESHEYPFVCTTNLMDSLDEASLRRFTFKIQFDFMTKEQVNKAMEHFFNIKNSNVSIKGLTAGDFATVKKKADFLNITSLKDLTKMLQEEVDVKKIPELRKTSIGF